MAMFDERREVFERLTMFGLKILSLSACGDSLDLLGMKDLLNKNEGTKKSREVE